MFELHELNARVCKTCKKVLLRNTWTGLSEELIQDELTKKVKPIPQLLQPKIFVKVKTIPVDFDKEKALLFEANVKVVGFLGSELVEEEENFTVRLPREMCDSCMKLISNYREGIIQLRGRDKEEAELMKTQLLTFLDNEKSRDTLSAVIKTINQKNGYDFWIGSRKATTKAANFFKKFYKAEIKESSKLIGVDEKGRNKFRMTYLIRAK